MDAIRIGMGGSRGQAGRGLYQERTQTRLYGNTTMKQEARDLDRGEEGSASASSMKRIEKQREKIPKTYASAATSNLQLAFLRHCISDQSRNCQPKAAS